MNFKAEGKEAEKPREHLRYSCLAYVVSSVQTLIIIKRERQGNLQFERDLGHISTSIGHGLYLVPDSLAVGKSHETIRKIWTFQCLLNNNLTFFRCDHHVL